MPLTHDLLLQPLRPALAEKATALIEAGLREHWPNYDPTMNPDLWNLCHSYGQRMLVATRGEHVVATLAWQALSDQTAALVRLSVARAWRRQSLARLMVAAMEGRLLAMGITRIELETTSHWDSVIRFYISAGYTATHEANGNTYFHKYLVEP